jgi:hypothetical protein
VVIWNCQASDRAESWTYSGGRFKHNSLCLNAKGNPVNGTKVILWTCDGSANEIWKHLPNGAIALKAHGYTLCLADPGSATKNGTQLAVATCRNKANQHWRIP